MRINDSSRLVKAAENNLSRKRVICHDFDGNPASPFKRKAIDPATDARESHGRKALLLGKRKRRLVARTEEFFFAAHSALPHGADRMNHVPGF